jgi:hypothetical protein
MESAFFSIFSMFAETRREDTLAVIKYKYSDPFLFISTWTDSNYCISFSYRPSLFCDCSYSKIAHRELVPTFL